MQASFLELVPKGKRMGPDRNRRGQDGLWAKWARAKRAGADKIFVQRVLLTPPSPRTHHHITYAIIRNPTRLVAISENLQPIMSPSCGAPTPITGATPQRFEGKDGRGVESRGGKGGRRERGDGGRTPRLHLVNAGGLPHWPGPSCWYLHGLTHVTGATPQRFVYRKAISLQKLRKSYENDQQRTPQSAGGLSRGPASSC